MGFGDNDKQILPDIINNPYYENNTDLFDELVKLLQKTPKGYVRSLNSTKTHLLKWLKFCQEHISEINLFNESHIKLSTICYWTIHGITNLSHIKYRCKYEHCTHTHEIRNVYNIFIGYRDFCSQECLNKSESHKQHVSDTLEKHFGVRYPGQSPIIAKKIIQTHKDNNGGKYFSDKTIKQIFDTRLERYGDENFNNREKCAETKLNKYGDKNYSNVELARKTRYLKNGDGQWHSKSYRKSISSKIHNKYKYNGQKFDSAPEVAFAIYCNDKDIKYIYHDSNMCFEYEYNGIKHFYHPDFYLIDTNQIVEIKGDHFFLNKDKNNRMVCPYDHTLDDKVEALHQCMIKHNVKIYTSDMYEIFIDYVNTKYGKNFIKTLKTKNLKKRKSDGSRTCNN